MLYPSNCLMHVFYKTKTSKGIRKKWVLCGGILGDTQKQDNPSRRPNLGGCHIGLNQKHLKHFRAHKFLYSPYLAQVIFSQSLTKVTRQIFLICKTIIPLQPLKTTLMSVSFFHRGHLKVCRCIAPYPIKSALCGRECDYRQTNTP